MLVIGTVLKNKSYKIYNHKYSFTPAFGVHPGIQTLPAYAIINIGETACNQ